MIYQPRRPPGELQDGLNATDTSFRPPGLTTRPTSAAPCPDAISCSSPLWASRRTSDRRIRNKRPSLPSISTLTSRVSIQSSPTEVSRPSSRDNLALQLSSAWVGPHSSYHAAYLRSTLEHDRLVARALAIREGTDRLGGLVIKSGEEFVNLLHSKGFQKPLPDGPDSAVASSLDGAGRRRCYVHIRSWKLVKRIEAEACIFYKYWPFDLCSWVRTK